VPNTPLINTFLRILFEVYYLVLLKNEKASLTGKSDPFFLKRVVDVYLMILNNILLLLLESSFLDYD